jgi:hypothetical protein
VSECELEEQDDTGSWFFDSCNWRRRSTGRVDFAPKVSPARTRCGSMMPRSGFSARLLLASVMLSSVAYGEPSPFSLLPSAPIPVTVKSPLFGAVDWSLAGSVVVARALDWASTEECLRRPWQECNEGELPAALVKNKPGFAAYEAGVSALSILAQYEMTRHGHRRLARLGQGIDVGSIGYTVVHNYRMAGPRW